MQYMQIIESKGKSILEANGINIERTDVENVDESAQKERIAGGLSSNVTSLINKADQGQAPV